jgi:hypothetical protein
MLFEWRVSKGDLQSVQSAWKQFNRTVFLHELST